MNIRNFFPHKRISKKKTTQEKKKEGRPDYKVPKEKCGVQKQ